MKQRSVGVDEEMEAEITEIAKKNNHSFTVAGYLLLKSALAERKRQAEKNKRRSTKADGQGS